MNTQNLLPITRKDMEEVIKALGNEVGALKAQVGSQQQLMLKVVSEMEALKNATLPKSAVARSVKN